jgi:hypothetical protein
MAALPSGRRRQANMAPSSLVDSFKSMSIRKGDTFHPTADTKDSQFWDPLERVATQSPSMPTRSTTCPKALEDLLIGAGDRRTAELFKRVDEAVATQSKLALGAILTEPEVLPVPTFTVHDTSVDERPVVKTRTHSHGSDSGIGTSISGSDISDSAKTATGEYTFPASPQTPLTHSFQAGAPTEQSFTHISVATEERGLSKYAYEQIKKHIVFPILKEEGLKEFHPLIKNVPARIGKKEIKSLRDLEKTLIFLAPVSPHEHPLHVGMHSYSWCFWRKGVFAFTLQIPAILRANYPRPAHHGHHTPRVRPASADRSTVHARLLF